jgi:hypothetical protein
MNNIDKLLEEIYSIEKKPELKDKYQELWNIVKSNIYKLDIIKSSDSGLKKSSMFTYNNMFIWDTKTNIVSRKKISSPLGKHFIKLRNLYKNYIKELNKINNKTVFKYINSSINRTEVLINILFLYGWNIERIKNENFDFNNYVSVYYKIDSDKLMSFLTILNKKNNDTKKLTVITLNIIKLFNTIIDNSKNIK